MWTVQSVGCGDGCWSVPLYACRSCHFMGIDLEHMQKHWPRTRPESYLGCDI